MTRALIIIGLCQFLSACGPQQAPPAPPPKPVPALAVVPAQQPRRADGTVDYPRLYEEHCAQGVTADNNAAPLLLRVFGRPLYFKEEFFKQAWSRLKMQGEASDAERLVVFDEVLSAAWESGAEDAKLSPRAQRLADMLPPGAAAEYRKQFKDRDAFIREMYRKTPLPPDGPWTAEQSPLLDVVLRANENALALLKQAAQKERMHLPGMYPPGKEFMIHQVDPPSGMYREGAILLLIRATHRLARGDRDGAWDDVKSCYRLAQLVAQEPSVTAMFGAIGIESRAHDTVRRMAIEGGFSAAQLKQCVADLGTLKRGESIQRALDIHERFLILDNAALMLHSKDHWKIPEDAKRFILESIDWQFVADELNRRSDEHIAAFSHASYSKRLSAATAWNEQRINRVTSRQKQEKEDIEALVKEMGEDAVKSLGIGGLTWHLVQRLPPEKRAEEATRYLAIWLTGRAAGMTFTMDPEERARMRMDVMRLTFALMAYRADVGVFPARLSDLAPGYIREVPLDRFTDKPLVYQARNNGFILYSLGTNLKDDGGAWSTAQDFEADIAVRVDDGKFVQPRYGRPATGEVRLKDD